MEYLLAKPPSEQLAFVTQLLERLSLEVEHIESDNLTDEQINEIKKAEAQIREGKFLTANEMNERFKEWGAK
ncbi:MAG: putative transcriptional regulator [Arenicella sp.]|jgi:predicted transcriptional regulator